MSTLFNFITIRNPRTPTQPELETGFIRFDSANLRAPVLRELISVRQQDYAGGRNAMLRARENHSIWKTQADFSSGVPGVARLAEWLSHNADTLTWTGFDEYAGQAEANADPAEISDLWDNLAVETYAGGPPDVRERVIWALRAVHLLTWGGPRDDDAVARRLAVATPLFPVEAHGLTPLERSGPEDAVIPEPVDLSAELRAKRESVHYAEKAYEELSLIAQRAHDHAKSEAVPPPYIPDEPDPEDLDSKDRPPEKSEHMREAPKDSGDQPVRPNRITLTQEFRANLSRETQSVLKDLHLSDGDSLALALTRVEAEAAARAAEVAAVMPPQTVTQVGGSFWVQTKQQPVEAVRHGLIDDRLIFQYDRFWGQVDPQLDAPSRRCQIRPLGVGDFRRVEQELCCYTPGEVAHIENVLKGETKERTTERKTTVETFTSLLTEEETTTERDSQTTDRFEMQKEVNKTIESDMKFEIGVNVAGSYGPVKITADTKFATSNSSKQSDRVATTFGKEVTDRTAEKVVAKVKEERTRRTTEEFTETNLHRLEATDDHVVGLFRWVDKTYKARVVNYGKRLMFEFLVPEPAAFHLHATAEQTGEAEADLVKPIDPRGPEAQAEYGARLSDHNAVTESNYAFWAALYDASVEPPPAYRVTTSTAYSREDMSQTTQFADSNTDLVIPADYEADRFNAAYTLHAARPRGQGRNWVTITVGRRWQFRHDGGAFSGLCDGEDDILPVSIVGRTRFYSLNLQVECTRTDAVLAQWRIRTFRAVMDGYAAKLAAYETALAEAKLQAGIEIKGTNPAHNRLIEQTELQKGCLRLLTSCADLSSNAVRTETLYGYPEFDCCQAIRDGSVVQFFEQLFEWPLMTYAFYPYFWGRKQRWVEIYRLDDVDPIFMSFLRAGYARVVVPVRPGYEGAALRYLADGSLWDGGSTPGVDDPMYVAIENDLKEPVGEVDPEIEPWEITLPTQLTVLQCGSACVPGTSLPCPCEDAAEEGEPGDPEEENPDEDESGEDEPDGA